MEEKNKKIQTEKGKLGYFKDILYSRKNKFTPYQRRKLKTKKRIEPLNQNWDDVEEKFSAPREELLYSIEKKRISIFMIFLVLSIIFFIGAVSYAFFYLTLNKKVLKQDIEMSIIGPNTVNSGTAFEFTVKLDNDTKWDFKDIAISVEYPKSTLDGRSGGIIENDVIKIDKPLFAGGIMVEKFNVILSGIVGDQKDIKVSAVYTPIGYSNVLSLTKIYQLKVGSSPISLEVDYPEKTLSEKEFTVNLDILSNTNIDLNSLLLVANLPQGFTATSFSIEPIFSNSSTVIFKSEDLPPGDKKNIQINGYLTGQNDEKKVFTFEIGDINPLRNEIRTLFAKAEKEILIKRPDLQLDVTINGEHGTEYIAQTNEELRVKLSLTNNLSSIVSDLKIEATINGDAYDKQKLKIRNGDYNSNNNTIIWDRNTWKNLIALNDAEKIEDNFLIKIKDLEKLAGYYKNPNINLHFKVSGTNFDSNSSDGDVVSEFTLNVKTMSHLKIESGTMFSIGPFKNIGKVPPIVGKETTYTAAWQIYNSTNMLENVEVRAKLPHYVKFLGNVSPEKYYVTYEPETREITWRLKKIEPYIGYRTDPKTVYFQVSIIPSANQVGNILELIGPKKIIADDTFIKTQISASQKKGDTTEILLDPISAYNLGKVISE